MDTVLPDISTTEHSPSLSALEWVGMQGIDLPIMLAEPGYRRTLHARADAQVDLPARHVKGIHMSRLYRELDHLADPHNLTPHALRGVLDAMVASHRDCDTRGGRVRLSFDLLARRRALVTEGLMGWKSYPVEVRASVRDGRHQLQIQVKVAYSSTCPCSAALARQLVEQAFLTAFGNQDSIDPDRVAAWLRQNATVATPHSQRSEARVQATLPPDAQTWDLFALIDSIEDALGTPVQTAVKRADEQAFAALNGQNLMFVEDAARRIQAALQGRFAHVRTHVCHMESLHPHDAVAWAREQDHDAQ